jgi:hypothetical protein
MVFWVHTKNKQQNGSKEKKSALKSDQRKDQTSGRPFKKVGRWAHRLVRRYAGGRRFGRAVTCWLNLCGQSRLRRTGAGAFSAAPAASQRACKSIESDQNQVTDGALPFLSGTM